jgi:hypothetical protein
MKIVGRQHVFVQEIIHFLIVLENDVRKMDLFVRMMRLVKEMIMVIIHVNVVVNGPVLLAQLVSLFIHYKCLIYFNNFSTMSK